MATVSGSGLNTTGLVAGDKVKITLVPTGGVLGVYTVSTVPSSSSFTFQLPGGSAASVLSVQKLFATGRAIIEGNVIELAPNLAASALTVPVAILVDDANPQSGVTPDYGNGDIIIRNNKVRYVDGTAPPRTTDLGVVARGAKTLNVTNNILDLSNAKPLINQRCQSAHYFNNRTPGGALARGSNEDNQTKYDELETEAEDAFLLAALQH